MDFLNKAKEKIAKTGGDVAKKAKDITEITKLKSQIASNENAIKTTYSEIGKYVYENLKDDAPAEIAEKMTIIDSALAEIERLKEEILKLKGSIKCEQCGAEVNEDDAFCPKCGTKTPEPVVDIIDEEEIKEVKDEPIAESEEKAE